MTINDAYLLFTMKINENSMTDGISVDLPRFVYMFNVAQDEYVNYVISKGRGDDLRKISVLLKRKMLDVDSIDENFNRYFLPRDYFSLSSVEVRAENDEGCKDNLLFTEIDPRNKEFYKVKDVDWEWRETVGYMSGNHLVVYKRGFEITDVVVEYYKKPLRVDITGYIHLDGTPSVDRNPEFSDDVVQNIVDLAASKFFSNDNDTLQKSILIENQVKNKI